MAARCAGSSLAARRSSWPALAAGLVVSGRMRASSDADARRSGRRRAGAAAARRRPGARRPAPGPTSPASPSRPLGAVTNIASLQVVRRQASPFANDPFFQYFFGDADEMFGYRNRYESSLGSGVVDLGRRLRPHQQPRRRRRRGRSHGRPRRQARTARQGHRRRSVHRPGPAQGRRAQPADDPVGRLVEAEGGRVGAGDRQPVPAEPDGHARHRQRARPRQRRHRRLRRLHPDRRRHQPRQLGRRAHQRARRAHRHQHRDLLAERRLPGHRLRRAEQPRPPRRRRPDEVRRGAARLDRLPRGVAAHLAPGRRTAARRPPRAWW